MKRWVGMRWMLAVLGIVISGGSFVSRAEAASGGVYYASGKERTDVKLYNRGSVDEFEYNETLAYNVADTCIVDMVDVSYFPVLTGGGAGDFGTSVLLAVATNAAGSAGADSVSVQIDYSACLDGGSGWTAWLAATIYTEPSQQLLKLTGFGRYWRVIVKNVDKGATGAGYEYAPEVRLQVPGRPR